MKKRSAFLLSLVCLAIVSCKKEKLSFDNTVARDNHASETYFNDLYKVVEDISANTDGVRDYNLGCIDTVIVDTLASPKRIWVDFGQDECVGNDGRVRKGAVLITYTGRYREEGTVIVVTPETYSVNGFAITGQKTITNLGLNSLGQPHFSIEVEGEVTAPANAYTLSWNSSRTRTWVEGFNTPELWDDAYEITGSASGINRFGNAYTATILQPLRAEIECPWIVSGTFSITPEDANTRIIDFGNGDCNAGYVITVDGTDYPINGGN